MFRHRQNTSRSKVLSPEDPTLSHHSHSPNHHLLHSASTPIRDHPHDHDHFERSMPRVSLSPPLCTQRATDVLFSLHHGNDHDPCTLPTNPYGTEASRPLSPEPSLPPSICPNGNFTHVPPSHCLSEKQPEHTRPATSSLLCTAADITSTDNDHGLGTSRVPIPMSAHIPRTPSPSGELPVRQKTSSNCGTSCTEFPSVDNRSICRNQNEKSNNLEVFKRSVSNHENQNDNTATVIQPNERSRSLDKCIDNDSKGETLSERKRRLARERQRKRRRRLRDEHDEKNTEVTIEVVQRVTNAGNAMPVDGGSSSSRPKIDVALNDSVACAAPELVPADLTEASSVLTTPIGNLRKDTGLPRRNSFHGNGSDLRNIRGHDGHCQEVALQEKQSIDNETQTTGGAKIGESTAPGMDSTALLGTDSSRGSSGNDGFKPNDEDPQGRKRRLARERQRKRRVLLKRMKKESEVQEQPCSQGVPLKTTDEVYHPNGTQVIIENVNRLNGDLGGSDTGGLSAFFDVNVDTNDHSEPNNMPDTEDGSSDMMVRNSAEVQDDQTLVGQGSEGHDEGDREGWIHWSSAFETEEAAQRAVNQVFSSLRQQLGGASMNVRLYVLQQVLHRLSESEAVGNSVDDVQRNGTAT